MKLILDFDRTLFDVEALYTALEKRDARHLAGTTECFALVAMADFIFPDVVAFLANKNREDVVIVSSANGLSQDWEVDYQAEKIQKSGVADLVGEVMVMRGEKGEVAAEIAKQFPPHEPIIFVDDRIEQCLSVRAAVPQAICCLMVRNKSVIGNVVTVQGMPVVYSMADVDAIIESL